MLAKQLERLRKQKNKTKKEIAEYLKLHETTYGKYELGNREPDSKTLCMLADYFEVTVDKLLGHSPFNDSQLENIRKNLSILRSEIDEVAARELGLDDTISLIEEIAYGDYSPSYDDLIEIANECGGTVEELLEPYKTEKPAPENGSGLDDGLISAIRAVPENKRAEAANYLRYLAEQSET
ncbi:MAG: helix-turn-helix transcriptional regulator [Oscillospiraceae bacterium]|nr:helix-turn-helix transcriptional regulator [Oscillospiraceae bacterium]